MKFKNDDRVIFYPKLNKTYSWKLDDFEEYTIINNYHDNNINKSFYIVKDHKDTQISWFEEEDFITKKEYRKLKLKNLNGTL